FNARAEAWAARHGKPVVGNGDVHRLAQLGATFSLVDAPPEASAICEAIRAGRVRVKSRPLSWIEVARVLGGMCLAGRGRTDKLAAGTEVACLPYGGSR